MAVFKTLPVITSLHRPGPCVYYVDQHICWGRRGHLFWIWTWVVLLWMFLYQKQGTLGREHCLSLSYILVETVNILFLSKKSPYIMNLPQWAPQLNIKIWSISRHNINRPDLDILWNQITNIIWTSTHEVSMSRMYLENDHCQKIFVEKKNWLKILFVENVFFFNVWHQFDTNSWHQFHVDSWYHKNFNFSTVNMHSTFFADLVFRWKN